MNIKINHLNGRKIKSKLNQRPDQFYVCRAAALILGSELSIASFIILKH